MTATSFVDANVIVYRHDAREPGKQRQADEWLGKLWTDRSGRTGIQALNETLTILARIAPELPREDRWRLVRPYFAWKPAPVSVGTMRSAFQLQDRYSLSWWDALIVAAALELRCEVLLTEDLQDGQSFGSVRVVNPFLHPPSDVP